MKGGGEFDFIFVDDDDINNIIGRMTVELTLGHHNSVKTFTNPLQALAFLKEFKPRVTAKATLLFLDLNMPGLSGWEFLEYFDNLPASTKDTIIIFILTSSVDPRDRHRSYANKNVKDFLVKPFNKQTLELILKKV